MDSNLHPEEGVVSIWVGNIATEDVYFTYLEETYSEEDDAPISQFAADMEVTFYDHDNLEGTFLTKALPIAQLLHGLSYGESFCEGPAISGNVKRDEVANATIVIYDHRFKRGKWPNTSPFCYVGAFPYEGLKEPPGPALREGDHSGRVTVAKIVTSDGLAATGSRYGEVRFWNTALGQHVESQSDHSRDNWIHGMNVSDDGRRMVTCSDELLLWDLQSRPITSRVIGRHGGYNISDVAISRDGNTALPHRSIGRSVSGISTLAQGANLRATMAAS